MSSPGRGSFAFANFLAALAGILASAISNVEIVERAGVVLFSDLAPELIKKIDWLIATAVLLFAYLAASYLISKFRKKEGIVSLLFRIPTWVELRNFGDQRVAKISYVALIAIPLLALFIVKNPLQWTWLLDVELPINMKISFFIAFFFSLALITFAVGCPKEFHKKDKFAGAKTVNLVLTDVNRTHIQLDDNDEYYDLELDHSKIELRAVCWLLYVEGLIFSIILLCRSALFVLYA